jgi:hypothetical protein
MFLSRDLPAAELTDAMNSLANNLKFHELLLLLLLKLQR